MIDREILQDYAGEARELLEEMDQSLIRLEREGGVPELLNNIFRAVHCIKGSAEYIGLERSGAFSHGVENLLDRLRSGIIPINPTVVDFLFRSKDLISALLEEVVAREEEQSDIEPMMEELSRILSGESPKEGAGEEDRKAWPEPVTDDFPPEIPTFDPGEEAGLESETTETESLLEGLDSLDDAGSMDLEADDFFGDSESRPLAAGEMEAEELDRDFASSADDLSALDETMPDEEPVEEAPAPELDEGMSVEGNSKFDSAEGIGIEETVPQVLALNLNLDDLEDGVGVQEVRGPMLAVMASLREAMDMNGAAGAATIVENMEDILGEIAPTDRRMRPDALAKLRALIDELRGYYPPDTFPNEDSILPEPALTPTEEKSPLPEPSPVSSTPAPPSPPQAYPSQTPPVKAAPPAIEPISRIEGFRRTAAISDEVVHALCAAGFKTNSDILAADLDVLALVPGVTRALAAEIHRAAKSALEFVRKELPSAKPGERSLMADIDADLLVQFESPSPIAEAPPSQPVVAEKGARPSSSTPFASPRPLLDAAVQETDRELAQIFVSFGWEIWREIQPIAVKSQGEGIGKDELEACADAIRKIKNSSSYMNYAELTSFLDDWREKTLWAVERFDSLNQADLGFLVRKSEEFEMFLRGLDEALQPEPTTRETPAPPKPASPSPPAHGRPVAPKRSVTAEDRRQTVGAPVAASAVPPGAPHARDVSSPAARPAPTPVTGTPPGGEITREQPTREEPTRTLPQPDKEEKEAPVEGPVVRTMRVEAAKVDVLLNQVGELVVNRSYVEQLSLELKNFLRELSGAREVGKKELLSLKDIALRVGEASLSLGRAATELQEGVMKLRMLPVGQLFNRMPRLIRDLARREGKTISMEVMGGDTEVDKRVIEQIYNPLVHLIRNAVDHGIEDPLTRKRLGKPEAGVIRLSAYSQGNLVVIDVEDDGGGVNHEAVVAEAVKRGIIDAREVSSFSAQEIAAFLFLPGFSTSRKVTRTSGRGVGMDVVKKDVEKINGQVEIESQLGKGTRISIKIPLTLAIIQTLLIRLGDHTFAVPLTSVREIIQTAPNELRTIEGFEVIRFRNETIPVLRMNEVFKMSGSRTPRRARYVVLATTGLKTVGFPVDDLVGEQDVVIKPLAEHVWKTRGLAGSTILGDGTIALVLDVAELVEDVLFRQRQMGGLGIRETENQGRNGLTSASAQ